MQLFHMMFLSYKNMLCNELWKNNEIHAPRRNSIRTQCSSKKSIILIYNFIEFIILHCKGWLK